MAAKKKIATKAEPAAKVSKAPKLDVAALYGDMLDTIEKRQGIENTGLDVAPPMSTGLLQVDMILGGGLRSCMITGAGNEQCAKTTLALTAMGNAIKEEIPFIAFADAEGCVTADTLIGYGKGKQARFDELFDLKNVDNWKPGWIKQTRTDIDTVESGHKSHTSLRSADLFYRGKMPTTELVLENGMKLTGHAHPVFVVENGYVIQKRIEDLQPGDEVLVKQSA